MSGGSSRRHRLRTILLASMAALTLAAAWFAARMAQHGFSYAIGIADRPTLHAYTDARYAHTQALARSIVAALEGYKAEHGTYPDRLEALVPAFLAKIEHPLVGDGQWQYTGSPDRFRLKFFVGPIYEVNSFDSRDGSWYVDR